MPAGHLWLCLALLLGSPFCLLPSRAEGVQLTVEDVDGDGRSERVLNNGLLRVVVDGGAAPEVREGTRYGDRFVWGGWIRELTFVPTGHEFLSLDRLPGGQVPFTGYPEEFEQPLLLREGEGDTPRDRLLKVGVGILEGTRTEQGNWRELVLVEPLPWRLEEENLADGGVALLFEQTAQQGGIAYIYRKRLVLRPGSSSLLVERELSNTGSVPIATTWYLHPCLAPEGANRLEGRGWGTAPLKLSDAPGDVDSLPCAALPPQPYGIWGGLPGRVVAEPWFAVGEKDRRHVLATSLERPFDWFRVWTAASCFALEPFFVMDLAPGETHRWSVRHQVGQGLAAVTAVREGILLDWQREGDELTLSVLPDRPRDDLRLQVFVRDPESYEVLATGRGELGSCHPAQPGPFKMEAPRGRDLLVKLLLFGGDGEPLAEVVRLLRQAAPVSGDGAGVRVVILSQPANEQGSLPPDVGYLEQALRLAAFEVDVSQVTSLGGWNPAWNQAHCVVLAGGLQLPPSMEAPLRSYVKAGGGLLQGAPLSLADTNLAEILPALPLGEPYRAPFKPYGQNRRLAELEKHRLHLTAAKDGDWLAGLPLWPAINQDIGVAWTLYPGEQSTVVARFADGGGDSPWTNRPALVTGRFGGGRICVTAFPLAWGMPPVWVQYARLGEFHRALLVRSILWSSGRL